MTAKLKPLSSQINALIKSLNGDGSIFFPPGIYELDSTIGPVDGVEIVGAGPRKTVFLSKDVRRWLAIDRNRRAPRRKK
jgi:hypothetical protein